MVPEGFSAAPLDRSEKRALNVDVVNVRRIDVLDSGSFHQNRTDFMRTALRRLLLAHDGTIKQVTLRKTLTVGVNVLDRRTLERARILSLTRTTIRTRRKSGDSRRYVVTSARVERRRPVHHRSPRLWRARSSSPFR
ncbi:hypothetical protein [Deinococcus pimensis]|uniref:hypothetical protein n=1 Tax=Deinococcus pimensis TaxID=309888 RepID=UPI00146F9884